MRGLLISRDIKKSAGLRSVELAARDCQKVYSLMNLKE
jgi:hypothetical protein